MKVTFFVGALCFGLPALAAAQTRAPITQGKTLGANPVFGGALVATVAVTPPEPFTPTVLNGNAESGASDLRLRLDYRYRVKEQLGGKNENEFVPYQTVTVRVENLSTSDPDNIAEFALSPSVSAQEGWYYASEVQLPPLNGADISLDQFRVTVTSRASGAVAVRSDALPASALFRQAPGESVLLFDGDFDLSTLRSLPKPKQAKTPAAERPRAGQHSQKRSNPRRTADSVKP